MNTPVQAASQSSVSTPATASIGSEGARLLDGPPGREDREHHLLRLGEAPLWDHRGDDLLSAIDASGLTGRGGGHFPTAVKLATARRAPGRPVVVVNATESEPASAKDRFLLEHRPHLVIDGALVAAAACGAAPVVLATHEGSPAAASLTAALRELGVGSPGQPDLTVATVPDRYLSGESSALVSYLDGGPALPASRGRPTAECGLGGRPTVVINAETSAHLALIARFGPHWFREAGTPQAPGSLLVTLAGDVAAPGSVLEVLRPVAVSDLVDNHAGVEDAWQAVLVGGYAGTWVDRDAARSTVLQGGRVTGTGPGVGCGLVAVLGDGRCGLAEAARLLGWLSDQRGGQCGACSFGLPLISEHLTALAEGRARLRSTHRRVASLAHSVSGRGLCHLPDGAIAMAESALEVFADEARLHRGRRCRATAPAGAFPLPPPPAAGGRP